MGGVKDGVSGNWVPIIDTANGWVQVGHKDTCHRYNDLNPHPPMWGLTGKENESITRHIMCCDEVPKTGTKTDVNVELEELSHEEELILDTMHPIWFGRKDGYHGTTHEEAELFCCTVIQMASFDWASCLVLREASIAALKWGLVVFM